MTGLTDIKVGEIRTLVRIFATLALGFFEVRLINTYAYPLYLGVHTYLREAVSLSSLVLYFVIALLAYRWPRMLSERRILGATISGLALGACLLAIALAVRAPGVIAAGAIVFGIARASAELLAAMALTTIGPTRSLPMLVCALIAAYVPEGALSVLPFAWGFGLYLAVPPLFLATGWPIIRQALRRWGDASAAGGAARDHAVTEPGAFLPFSHRFFVAMFVLRVAYGLSLTFNASMGVAVQAPLVMVPLVIVALWCAVRRRIVSADVLYQGSTLLVISGLLAMMVPQLVGSSAPNALLTSGADLFVVFARYGLAVIGYRSPAASLLTSAWGIGIMQAGVLAGTGLGALFGSLLATDSAAFIPIVALLTLLFTAFSLVLLQGFSFEEAVSNVRQPPMPVVSHDDDGTGEAFAACCEKLAVTYGLTNRERDVLRHLARGRNVPFMQEDLHISHNTVRTHVKHIYQKMGIRSQQELIELVLESQARRC